MNEILAARKLLKIARLLISRKREARQIPIEKLSTYDLVDELNAELSRYFRCVGNVGNNEIQFSGMFTKKDLPVRVTVIVDPRSQPKRIGKCSFCLLIEGEEAYFDEKLDGVGIICDECWTEPDDETVAQVAKVIARITNRFLSRW